MPFNPSDYEDVNLNRYKVFLDSLDHPTDSIEKTVNQAVNNIKKENTKSFVIYGEPQSGKTSMMIALTSKLLDENFKFIVILVQDNLALEEQNRERFQFSTLNPTPKRLEDILPKDVNIEDREVIVFCKKNSQNLLRLIKRTDHIKNKIIIDDEADYASPNSKINKVKDGELEKTKINERIYNLIGKDGIYIGVTATPARLDLNNTFENENHRWVFFKPHQSYKGQDFFFPIATDGGKFAINYDLVTLRDQAHDPGKELRESIFRFMVNATFLNLYANKEKIKNYIMLIHTSVKMENHTGDRIVTEETLSELAKHKSNKRIKYLEKIYSHAFKKTNDDNKAKEITKFIAKHSDKYAIGVMNSSKHNKIDFDLKKFTTNPAALFTISIGGNTISRGLTFNNLISMFFTRGVKTIMQQDTYIQRARMFGPRPGIEAENFELTITDTLYTQWFSCFVLHRLSYLSAINNLHQVWVEGSKTRAVAPSSVDKSNVRIDKGEISFEKVLYKSKLEETPTSSKKKILLALRDKFGNNFIPKHVIDFINVISVNKEDDIAIHQDGKIEKWADADYKDISRARGIFGNFDYDKFPLAKHHFKVISNEKGYARMFYNFRYGKVSFLRNTKNKIDPIDLNQFAQLQNI
jgi:hypothetical protein